MVGGQVAKYVLHEIFYGDSEQKQQISSWTLCEGILWYHTVWNEDFKGFQGFPPPRVLPDYGNLPLSLALGVLGISGYETASLF